MIRDALRDQFGSPAVDLLLARLNAGASPEVDPELFGEMLFERGITADVISLLDAAVEAGLVERVAKWRCHCKRIVDADAVENLRCPYCGADYRETGDEPIETSVYRSLGGASRSVPWLVAIHGFNTRGSWQEEFSWRIANRFKYHAPVLIYKYGLVRVSVLFRWRHRMLARELGQRIRKATIYAKQNQIEEPPDIVIHSFGSQLFRLVLEMPEFSDLRFGRIIAVGSVIRPDFDWSRHIRDGRVEAILDQCGGNDWAVPFAQFTIPGSGPGGSHGFVDAAVMNVRNDRYGHSTAFREQELVRNLSRGGMWDRFLREPLASFSDETQFKPEAWFPALVIFRLLANALVIVVIGAMMFVSATVVMSHLLKGKANWTLHLLEALLRRSSG